MRLVVAHLPHLIPALVGVGFLARFTWQLRKSPPADLTDQELAAWQEARSGSRKRTRARR